MHALVRRGGGIGLFTGCAAGDTGAALRARGRVIERHRRAAGRRAPTPERRPARGPVGAPDGARRVRDAARRRVWQESLVAALVALGHTEQTARQAVARSTRDGWLSGERVGRRTRMTVTPETAQMLEQGRERIFGFGRERRVGPPLARRRPAHPRGAPARPPSRAHAPRPGRHGLARRRASGSRRTPIASRSSPRRCEAAGATDEAISFRADMGSLGRPRTSSAAWDLERARRRVRRVPRPLRAAPAARRRGGVPRADRARPRAGGGSRSSTPTCRPSSCRAAGRGGGPTSSSTAATPRGTPRRRRTSRARGASDEAREPVEDRRRDALDVAGSRSISVSSASDAEGARARSGRDERRRATARRVSSRSRAAAVERAVLAPRDSASPPGRDGAGQHAGSAATASRSCAADPKQRRRAAAGEERLVEVAVRGLEVERRLRAVPRAPRSSSSQASLERCAPGIVCPLEREPQHAWARAGSASRRRRPSPPPRPPRRARPRCGRGADQALARERPHGLAKRRRADVPLPRRAPRRGSARPGAARPETIVERRPRSAHSVREAAARSANLLSQLKICRFWNSTGGPNEQHRRQEREHRRGRLRRVLRRARRARPPGALEPAAQDHAGRPDPEPRSRGSGSGTRSSRSPSAPARSSRSSAAATAACSRSRTRASNGLPFTSTTLWGAIQYLGPGETAPAHRHTPSAIRFVMTGSGVYTTVDGDACEMEPGDLILTPNWKWHDHNNYGDEPMVWFDGLDLPLMVDARVDLLREPPRPAAAGARPRPLRAAPQRRPGSRRRARSATRSTRRCFATRGPTPSASSRSCTRARGGHEATVEYLNPATGGPAIRTFASEMTRLFPGARTPTRRARPAARSTSSSRAPAAR